MLEISGQIAIMDLLQRNITENYARATGNPSAAYAFLYTCCIPQMSHLNDSSIMP